MEWFSEWALTLCSASAACAAVGLLVPDDRFEKVMKLALSAFMLLLVISPLTRLDSCSFEFSQSEDVISASQSRIEEYVTHQARQMASQAAAQVIEQRLQESGIFAQEISVYTDSSDDGCISIGQVTVIMDDADEEQHQKVCEILRDVLGLENVNVCGGR